MKRVSRYLPLSVALLSAGLMAHAQTLSVASLEYNNDFKEYQFIHTEGFPNTKHRMDWPDKFEDPDEWEFLTEEEKGRLGNLGITLPDFSFMTPDNSKYSLASGQVRQRTHTVEHILYAMPGDLVPMYPYYGLSNPKYPDYEDKFSHWYDFTSGGCLTYELGGQVYDMIDFLDDRQHMHRIAGSGFFGGETLNTIPNGDKWKRIPGTFANFFCPRTSDGKLPFSEGQTEYVIAADFSQTFSTGQHIDSDNKTITESLIAFRHIFRIRDGKAFADEFSGSVEKNRIYINKHQKMVTAPAGKFFQIRLESPLPVDYRLGQSIYYYKRQDGTYGRVCGHAVKVFNGDTGEEIGNPGFSVWDREDRRVSVKRGFVRQEGDGSYYTGKDNPDAVNYVTMLYNQSAPAGHYIVQFLGSDENNNPIKLKDSNGTESDLVIMEYNISFLPEEGASVITETELYGQDKFKHARDEELREQYGEPADFIDFDEYIKINQMPDEDKDLKEKLVSYSKYRRNRNEEDGSWHYDARIPDDAPFYIGKEDEPTVNGKEHSFYKWPVPWSQSSYSFGYRYRHDYSMYMLATHSRVVPYKDAAAEWPESSNMSGDGSGLYDRLYYKTMRQNGTADPSKVEQGYFYYVNAASDPGVSARLNINITCPGSRIVVSAWIAEFSKAEETANISFNFVAVMKETGERIVLHNFITGYVPADLCGKWLNVYYSFVPRLAEFTDEEGDLFSKVDHYELELDNNTTSSAGADYAIDDIRAYVVHPNAEADQLSFACDNDDIRLRLGVPFETLLEKIGKAETIGSDEGDNEDLYYAFVDKEKFNSIYKDGQGSLDDAYDAAVVKTKDSGGSVKSYGKVTFKSNYLKNDDIDAAANIEEDKAYRLTEASKERMIVFERTVQLSDLKAGREYYVVFRSSLGGEDTPAGDEVAFFNLADPCANKCVSVIRPANTIKVDGEIRKDLDRLIVCENQSPVIQVNIAGRFEDGHIEEVEKNARFDWFDGTLDQFNSAANTDGQFLSDALWVFRSHYPDRETTAGAEVDAVDAEGTEGLKKWMIDLINEYATPTEEYPNGRLSLYRSSYVVAGIQIPSGETEATSHVVAIPIPDNDPNKRYHLCTSPTELELKFANQSPSLLHGLTDVAYPATMVDVPLRIGLEQIRLEKDVLTGEDMKTVVIPVRKVASSSSSLKLAKESAADAGRGIGCIILVQTNDPEYRHLGTLENGEEIEELLWVGEVTELKATKGAADNLFKAKFDKDFDFKEGYFYRMRFQYEETAVSEGATVCNGHDVFTLKIVPKYLLWTGGDNLNWNCDANWSRLDSEELYSAADDRKRFVTDGSNDRRQAYSPLNFTYTVIKEAPEAPWLYAYGTDEADALPDRVGLPTPLIQFDMAACPPDRDVMTTECEKWYAHTCKEIHFKPGATIMGQQRLSYERAWVDMELDPQRWYTVSSPLQEVYAGDFYLPAESGRQETELFQDIAFDFENGVHNRFIPAVYQRGWDKSVAKVYEIDKPDFRDVIVKANWSHVYNDVTEQYGGGTGFSIKTDISAMDAGKQPERVMFRLPKADGTYSYYDNQGNTNSAHDAAVDRSANQYKLNPVSGTITARTGNAGNYFLVGNPFMTHMDIAKFLDTNKDKLEQKFWIVTATGQIAGTVGQGGVITTEPSESGTEMTAIAPMQGFFVKTLAAATQVDLSYDASMMRRYAAGGAVLTGRARAAEVSSMLRITAYNDGEVSSSAIVATGFGGEHMQSVEAIDNRGLELPSLVYTIGAGQAQSINFLEDADGVEIGVAAEEGVKTVLVFEGVEALDGLSLLDKQECSLTELYDGMEMEIDGPASGRFFLTSASGVEDVYGGVEWSVDNGGLIAYDRAHTGHLSVTVYDTLGRTMAEESSDAESLRVGLPQGIYVVEVANGAERKSFKIRI